MVMAPCRYFRLLLWIRCFTISHAFLPSSTPKDNLLQHYASEQNGIGVGIDLGTTNSAVAFLDGNTPKIIEIPNNGRTMKSVVAFDESGTALVGSDALEWERTTKISAYRHVKRVIGTGVNFLSKETVEVVPHLILSSAGSTKAGGKKSKKKVSLEKVMQDASDNPTMLAPFHKGEDGVGNSISPEVISSAILKHLIQVARDYTKKKITRAVVGVPAYFNDQQREATIRAAKLAGVEKVKLLREPEAAALAYGVDKDSQEEELVLVFDLGGGTFDVSMLLVEKGLTEIICTSGNPQLGGSNFDAKIAQQLGALVGRSSRSEECSDMMVRAAEAIRIYLSNNRQVDVALPRTDEGWTQLNDPDSVIIRNHKDVHMDESNSTHVIHRWTRKEVEPMFLDELLLLLRPIREVAIMAGALLPGDARPSVVESALEMQAAFLDEPEFYDEDDDESTSRGEDEQMISEFDFKAAKKKQQQGRKKARQVAKDDRKYQTESRRVLEQQNGVTDKPIRADGISGRPIGRVVMVGGATRMPAIGRLLTALTGIVPKRTVDPDEAVALGCAVHVGILDGNQEMGTVLNPMQAAILRAVVEKQRRSGLDQFPDDNVGEFELDLL